MTTDPVGRPMRASDQDRTEAVLALTDHFTAGRLDKDEFEERMGAAQQAVFLHDLDPLFADLGGAPTSRAPVVRPAGRPDPRWAHAPRRRPAFVPLIVAAVITAVVLTGGHVLWLLLPVWWIALSATHRRRWARSAYAAPTRRRVGSG